MKTETEKPTLSTSSGDSCWDDVPHPGAAPSPSSNSEDGLLRTKRHRRAPKPFEPEPDKPKRRRATNQPVRDSDGRFIKRTSSPRKRAPVSTSPSSVAPTRDAKGRFFKAEGDACNVLQYFSTGLVTPSRAIDEYSSHSPEPFAQNFVDSILNFPDEEAHSSAPVSPNMDSSLQGSESAVSEDFLTCVSSKIPDRRIEVPVCLSGSTHDDVCVPAVPFASNLLGMDDFLLLPSQNEDAATYDAWTIPAM